MAYRDEDFFDRVENSELSPRLVRVLLRAGVERLSTLNRMTDHQILMLPNIGPDSLKEIRARLRSPGTSD